MVFVEGLYGLPRYARYRRYMRTIDGLYEVVGLGVPSLAPALES